MVLALRCPTEAPEQLRTMYRDGVAVCDSIRAYDEEREAQKGEVRIDSRSFDASLTSISSTATVF